MKVIGLTGGIATGKSTVSRMLKNAGIPVVDADDIARRVVEPGQPAYNEIVNRFGKEILQCDGTLNRKRLGEIVFADKTLLQELNAITHPRIRKTIEEKVEAMHREGRTLLVLDIPLLLESDWRHKVDEIWLVYCEPFAQKKRLKERDGLSENEIENRLQSQMPLEKKRQYAHHIIDNSYSPKETKEQVKKLLQQNNILLKEN